MSFFGRARGAAAERYGQVHYARYARRARINQFLGWVLLAGALVFFYVIGHQ